VKKSLYSTTVVVKDLEDRGWVYQDGRNVKAHSIKDRFEYCRGRPRKEMKTDLDQAQFLIGGAITGDINLEEELTRDTWMVSPLVVAVLDWYGKFCPDEKVAEAAKLAAEILRRTKEKLQAKPEFVDRQLRLFELEGELW
jgi:phenylpyruvate tautomerase PptA (4-oxalocrotonate tautomerase family)